MDTATKIDPEARYSMDGWNGIAWAVLRQETEFVPSIGYGWDYENECEYEYEDWEDPEEIPIPQQWVCCMVGDDREFTFHEGVMTKIADEDYCGGCGQIGCGWGA